MAVSYFYGGEPRRAIEFLTQAGNLNPNPKGRSGNLMMNLCRAHFMLGDYDSAIQWCLKALDKDPKNHYAHAYLALAYSVKGEDEKARAAVAELRKLPLGRQLSQKFERPQPSYPAAYQEWYEKKFLPVARKVGVIP